MINVLFRMVASILWHCSKLWEWRVFRDVIAITRIVILAGSARPPRPGPLNGIPISPKERPRNWPGLHVPLHHGRFVYSRGRTQPDKSPFGALVPLQIASAKM